jgi:4-aminobutyrate aminotransferase-like enzyme
MISTVSIRLLRLYSYQDDVLRSEYAYYGYTAMQDSVTPFPITAPNYGTVMMSHMTEKHRISSLYNFYIYIFENSY